MTEEFLNGNNPMSRVMLGIIASLAENESNMISKRVSGLNGEIFEGKHEAIVSEELFNLVQSIIDGRGEKSRKFVQRSKYMLTGIIKHQECGGAYYKMNNYQKEYYTCHKCGKTINKDKVEKLVITEFKKYVKSLGFLKTAKTNKKGKETKLKDLQSKNVIFNFSIFYIL